MQSAYSCLVYGEFDFESNLRGYIAILLTIRCFLLPKRKELPLVGGLRVWLSTGGYQIVSFIGTSASCIWKNMRFFGRYDDGNYRLFAIYIT